MKVKRADFLGAVKVPAVGNVPVILPNVKRVQPTIVTAIKAHTVPMMEGNEVIIP